MNSGKTIPPTLEQTRKLLKSHNYVKLINLCRNDRKYLKALKFAVYDVDETISRPAGEAVAHLMQSWWRQGEQEKVREYIRGLLWSLNDESGGIGWNSPQQIAEAVVEIPELADPYASIMISRCIDEPPLFENMLWAIGRMGKLATVPVNFFAEGILGIFTQTDPQVLGTAAWAMGEVGFAPAGKSLRLLKSNPEPACIYINGEFIKKTVGDWATGSLAKIGAALESDSTNSV